MITSKKFSQGIFVPLIFKYLLSALLIVFTTFFLKKVATTLEIQIIALVYMLPVIAATVWLGLTPGILTVFLSFLAFNYFFIQPYNTLLVHKTRDLIFLIIFLIVSGVMSQLIGQAREGLKLARMREWEATRMYELISALSAGRVIEEILQILVEHISNTFECDFVEVSMINRETRDLLRRTLPVGDSPQYRPDFIIPIETTGFIDGKIRIWKKVKTLTPEKMRLLNAYGSQASYAVERVYLKERENKVQLLEDSDRLKTSLLNSVSHELRSPLAAIKASVSSLRSGTVDWDKKERVELLSTIEEETDHLNLLVGNLLDMSRIESGSLKPNLRWNSVAEIAMGVVEKVSSQLQNHRVEFDFPDNLPLVLTDYVMLSQVFSNLISNSVKYAPENTAIIISAREEGDSFIIQVRNQSPRIPDDHLERIFEKFHRITAADKTTGTGLGLSICRGIIEAHGGQIFAENRSDCFQFVIQLPLNVDDIPRVT